MSKKPYMVSFMCIYSDSVLADSPEEAADIVADRCPYDIEGEAHVVDLDSDEEWDV